MITRWRITGTLTATSPLHVGSGLTTKHDAIEYTDENGEPKLCDIQAVVREHRGKPCVPGTALKGVLRSWAETMLPKDDQGNVAAPHAAKLNRIFGHRNIAAEGAEAGWAEFCTATAVEPSAHQKSEFSAHVPYWREDRLTGILSHVSIDRYSGAAKHEKLYFEEFVPEGITFAVEIDATRLNEDEVRFLLAILEQGTSHRTHPLQFGANGSDGWGRMSWKLVEMKQCVSSPWPPTAQHVGVVGFDCCTEKVDVSSASIKPLTAPAHVSLGLDLICKGPFLVNDASRTHRNDDDGLPHFIPLRRADGSVWLPASSLRGVLRERTEFLLRSIDPIASGDPAEPAGIGPIERIFGHTGRAARLRIEEPDENGSSAAARQDFVAIDRFSGGAAEGAKFDTLYADGPHFHSQLLLDLDGLRPVDLALLRLALRDLCRGLCPLGWGGAKGYGEVHATISAASIDDLPADWGVPDSFWSTELDYVSAAWIGEKLSAIAVAPQAACVAPLAEAAPLPTASLETLQGKLTVTKTASGKLVYQLSYKRAGKDKTYNVQDLSQIASGLLGVPATGVDVDFEIDGKPVAIRPHGAPKHSAKSSFQGDAVDEHSFANPYYFLRMEERERFTEDLADAEKPIGHRCSALSEDIWP